MGFSFVADQMCSDRRFDKHEMLFLGEEIDDKINEWEIQKINMVV